MTGHRMAVLVLLAAWAWCAWQAVHEQAWPIVALCVVCAAVTAVAGWPRLPGEEPATGPDLTHPGDEPEVT